MLVHLLIYQSGEIRVDRFAVTLWLPEAWHHKGCIHRLANVCCNNYHFMKWSNIFRKNAIYTHSPLLFWYISVQFVECYSGPIYHRSWWIAKTDVDKTKVMASNGIACRILIHTHSEWATGASGYVADVCKTFTLWKYTQMCVCNLLWLSNDEKNWFILVVLCFLDILHC